MHYLVPILTVVLSVALSLVAPRLRYAVENLLSLRRDRAAVKNMPARLPRASGAGIIRAATLCIDGKKAVEVTACDIDIGRNPERAYTRLTIRAFIFCSQNGSVDLVRASLTGTEITVTAAIGRRAYKTTGAVFCASIASDSATGKLIGTFQYDGDALVEDALATSWIDNSGRFAPPDAIPGPRINFDPPVPVGETAYGATGVIGATVPDVLPG